MKPALKAPPLRIRNPAHRQAFERLDWSLNEFLRLKSEQDLHSRSYESYGLKHEPQPPENLPK
jgi:hypothetical protein